MAGLVRKRHRATRHKAEGLSVKKRREGDGKVSRSQGMATREGACRVSLQNRPPGPFVLTPSGKYVSSIANSVEPVSKPFGEAMLTPFNPTTMVKQTRKRILKPLLA